MEFIDNFIADLAAFPESEYLANPYLDVRMCENLRAYLTAVFHQPGRRVLLVGEALGYRGGVLTGIPFSSARLASQSSHKFWRELRPDLSLAGDTSEATASIVWDYLASRRRIPLCWNGLPFHPHHKGDRSTNRAPQTAELERGRAFLTRLIDAYQPDRIAAVGGKAATALACAAPSVSFSAIRHPSYGGKREFVEGMDRLLR